MRQSLTAVLCIVTLILSVLPVDIPVVGPLERVHAAIDDPTDVSGLLLWLDAGDPDADGNSANNPSDGSDVNTWHDKSGNNNDATVYSGETAATYESAAGDLINGNPVLYFDRTGQSDGSVYEVSGVDIRAGTNEDITIFTVYQPQEAALTGSQHYGLWGADNGSWDRFFATNHRSFGDGVDDGLASLGPTNQGAVVADAGVVDTVRLMTAVYDGEVTGGVNSGPTNGSSIYFNGAIITQFTDDTDDLAAQDRLFIGWDGDDGAYDGDIAEMVVYNRILTCTEFNDVTKYLSDKYGQSFNVISPGGVSCGLNLWLKANAGVTGTSQVSDWADQSGNDHDFTQGTSTNRPALTANALNFNPAITFDGNDNFLEDADGEDYLNGESAYSSFVVVDSDATNDGFIFRSSTDTSNAEAPWGIRYDQSGFETGHSNIMKFGIGTTSDTHKLYEIDENNAVSTDPLLVDFQWTSGQTPTLSLYHAQKPLLQDDGGSTIGGSITGADYIRIGQEANGGGHDYWDGHIAEVVMYNEDKSATDTLKINSYLGLKYGLTLSGGTVNYLSASGSVVWDASANSGYKNDIAGLGRDDESALTQYKSKSVHSDAILTMSGTVAEFLDYEFLVWGNDNGSTAETESNTPGSVRKRLGRIWHVEETGDTGNVRLEFDLTGLTITGTEAKHFTLIIDNTDTDFESGVTTQTAATYSSNIATFTNVNLSDGAYIALGTDTVAPGGVSTDLQLWLRGDTGVTPDSGTLTGWTDQTANNTFTINGNPQTGNSTVNFNNVIEFDGTGDYMDGDATIDMRTFFSVFDDTAQDGGVLFGPAEETAGATKGYFWRYLSSNAYIGDTSSHYTRTTTSPPSGYFLYGAEKKGGSVGTDSRIMFQGADQPMGSHGGNNPVDQHTSTPRLARGSDPNGGSEAEFTGNIAEIAVYGGSGMSSEDELKVHSYLGIKYGVTLSGGTVNYLSASGAVVWGTGSNVGYTNDIAGIGRDDASNLDQYKSISLNSDAVVTMSGSAANFTNHEFLMWANDSGDLSFGAAVAAPNANERLHRIWKTQETGDTGAVTATFSGSYIVNGTTYYLLTDDDGNFSNGGTTEAAKVSATNDVATFTDVNIASSQYFTLARNKQKSFFQFFFFGM